MHFFSKWIIILLKNIRKMTEIWWNKNMYYRNPLRDREVLGSNPPGARSYQRLLYGTATLCDAPHLKSLNKVNNASTCVVGLRLTMLKIHLYQYCDQNTLEKEISSSALLVDYVSTKVKLFILIRCSVYYVIGTSKQVGRIISFLLLT